MSTVHSILDEKGIKHKLTMPYSPQQNGLAKRWNCTLLDKARMLLHGTGLSLGFWECAVDTAVHIYNRTPSRSIGWWMPHKLWTNGHIPDVSYFRVFRSKAYVHTPEDKRKKLNLRLIEMTLVEYKLGSKGYWLWNSNTQSIILSHNMTFDKRSFPFKETGPSATPLQPAVSEGRITIYYNALNDTAGGSVPQLPTLPTTPAQCPTPEQAETEFHTPLSQPAAQTPLQQLQPQHVHRDPGVPPCSTLPSPAFGPTCPPSPRHLRANPKPNPQYHNPDNVVCTRGPQQQ